MKEGIQQLSNQDFYVETEMDLTHQNFGEVKINMTTDCLLLWLSNREDHHLWIPFYNQEDKESDPTLKIQHIF